MRDTPRTDSYVYKFPGCQREPRLIDFARQLEKELAEARAEVEHWKGECNALQRMVHESRARIDHLERIVDVMIEEQAALCAEGQSITELVAAKDKLIERMGRAMEKVIANYRVNLRDLTDFENKQVATLESALTAERGE